LAETTDLLRIREYISVTSVKENRYRAKWWENNMVQKYVLETEGYRICFVLQETQAAKESAEVVVELSLDRSLGDVAVQSVPTLMTVHDLSRLVAYFEAHIARLQQHLDSESDVFVPLELGLQVQALAGEVQAEDDGEFSMRFFVNVGESSQAGHRVYIGGESVVTLKNLQVFLASLHEALVAWSRTHGVSPV
jgi:hypothetical protein